jgi:hypothetical protein
MCHPKTDTSAAERDTESHVGDGPYLDLQTFAQVRPHALILVQRQMVMLPIVWQITWFPL